MTEDDVFSAEESNNISVTCGNTTKNFEDSVELSDVQELAREEGIKEFQVAEADSGDKVTGDDFPATTNLKITEYNENA